MTFAQFNFDPKILKAIEICGYNKPTPVQISAIPQVLEGKDLVVNAQTGTGKTAAFILPALQKLSMAQATIKPRVLVLTPTRELAAQIISSATKYGKFLNFKMTTLVGGAPYRQQLRDLSRPCDIIVATPGRLLDHMENKKVDLSAIEMLILDEADRMLDMGFIDDVKLISKAIPHTKQTLLFSATVDARLSQIIKQLLKHPTQIDLSTEKLAPVNIQQQLYIADSTQHKTRLLEYFLTETSIYKAIIFSATKVNADKLAKELKDKGLSIAALHGDLKQAVRNRTIEQFRRGKVNYLIATDVAARGIDISDVTHVINYDLPKFSEDYVHRIGRTGRAGKTGVAISFVLPIDNRHLQKIERYTGQRLEVAVVPGLEAKSKLLSASAKIPRKSDAKKKRFSGGDKKFSGKKSSDKKYSDKKFADKKFSNKEFSGKKFADKKFGDKESSGKKFVDKKFGDKEFSGRKFVDKKFGDKESSGRKFADKKFGDKESSGRKFADKKFGDKEFSGRKFADKKSSDKEFSGKKFGDKKFSGKKFGDKKQDDREFSGKKFAGKKSSSEKTFSKKRFADNKAPRKRSADQGKKKRQG